MDDYVKVVNIIKNHLELDRYYAVATLAENYLNENYE